MTHACPVRSGLTCSAGTGTSLKNNRPVASLQEIKVIHLLRAQLMMLILKE